MIILTEDYIVEKFFQYCGIPKRNRYNNTYQGSCPICREGKSWLKKRRCFFIPKNNNIFCHNCGWSGTPYSWIKKVSGVTDIDLIQDVKQLDNVSASYYDTPTIQVNNTAALPEDSINLFDQQQIEFYTDQLTVQECLNFIKRRKLDIAVNRPNALYVSLTDKVHKNRLIIPFYNEFNKIEFYQTRTVLTNSKTIKAKYISKVNGEKTLYGLNKLDSNHNTVYIFEGPINAMFVVNGIAVAGIQKGTQQFTSRQQEQLQGISTFYNKVWVLDSQWLDNTSLIKTETLLKQGEKVFIWPEKFGKKFKDFNEMTVKYNLSSISRSFINNHTYDSLTSLIKLSEIKKHVQLTGNGI